MDIWTKPILPLVNDQSSYAIGILSHRVDGYPYRLNFTLSELNLTSNANIYSFKVRLKLFVLYILLFIMIIFSPFSTPQ